MTVRQIEPSFHIEMALKARFRIFFGVDDGVACAARLRVDTARAVTGLATDLERGNIRAFRVQPGVSGRLEIARDVLVTLRAVVGPDKCRPRNLRRHDDHTIDRHAGNQCARRQRGRASDSQLLAMGFAPREPKLITGFSHSLVGVSECVRDRNEVGTNEPITEHSGGG